MVKKLNGWARIGVVVSVVWILAVFAVVVTEYLSDPRSSTFFVYWVNSKTGDPIPPNVTRNHFFDLIFDVLPGERVVNWGRLLGVLIFPVIAGWFSAYLGIWTFRWIRQGFEREK
jgi:hypothetical protein